MPRQEIAIDGSGFTAEDSIPEDTVSIGGVLTTHGDQLVNNNGDVSFNLLVPDGVSAGTREVWIVDAEGRVGVANITVADPTITIDPEESLIGSDVVVTGSGFPANDLVLIRYNDSVVETAPTSSTGDFQDTITVPSGTGPGSDNPVSAESQVNEETLMAEAEHSLPDASITLTPASAEAGSTITISGDSFLGFLQIAEIEISSTNVTPVPSPETDVWGAFSAEGIRVPQLSPGRYAVQVTVDENSATEFLQVVEATVEVVTDPAEIFADLIEADQLDRIFLFVNTTREWFLYDPDPGFEAANSLEMLESGDIIWIQLKEAATVQGTDLLSGWSLVTVQ